MFIVFLGLAAQSYGAERRGGDWWSGLTEYQKQIFVIGFFDGQLYAERIFDGAMLLSEADPKTRQFSPNRARILGQAEDIAIKAIKHDFNNVNAGRLVQGLDKIYADYKNTRIQVVDAMVVVVRSMDGTSDEEIVKLLERKRADATAK